MQKKELLALINLLDDENYEIYKIVKKKLIKAGKNIIPYLKATRKKTSDELLIERIDEICDVLNYKLVRKELKKWSQKDNNELLYGTFLIAKLNYPNLDFEKITEKTKKISAAISSEIEPTHTAVNKIKIINRVIYNKYKFAGNINNFFAAKNSYINDVLNSKKGSHIVMSVIYAVIAKELKLPVYAVDFPGNMLLAFKDIKFNTNIPEKDILFYINPFNGGIIITKRDIDVFLRKNNIPVKETFFLPTDNNNIIRLLMKFLIRSYSYSGGGKKIKRLKKILKEMKK